LPDGNKVRVYELNKIIYAKKKMSIGEKIDNLIKVKKNLEKKLKILAEGRCIVEFDYVTPSQWRAHKYGALQAEKKSLSKTVKT